MVTQNKEHGTYSSRLGWGRERRSGQDWLLILEGRGLFLLEGGERLLLLHLLRLLEVSLALLPWQLLTTLVPLLASLSALSEPGTPSSVVAVADRLTDESGDEDQSENLNMKSRFLKKLATACLRRSLLSFYLTRV